MSGHSGMPISYDVDVDLNLVQTVATGIVSNADLSRHVASLAVDPRVQAGYRELFDARDVLQLNVSQEAFDQMAEIEQRHLEKFTGTCIAIVVQNIHDYDYAERFEKRMAARPVTVITFTNMDIARTWLGLTTDVS